MADLQGASVTAEGLVVLFYRRACGNYYPVLSALPSPHRATRVQSLLGKHLLVTDAKDNLWFYDKGNWNCLLREAGRACLCRIFPCDWAAYASALVVFSRGALFFFDHLGVVYELPLPKLPTMSSLQGSFHVSGYEAHQLEVRLIVREKVLVCHWLLKDNAYILASLPRLTVSVAPTLNNRVGWNVRVFGEHRLGILRESGCLCLQLKEQEILAPGPWRIISLSSTLLLLLSSSGCSLLDEDVLTNLSTESKDTVQPAYLTDTLLGWVPGGLVSLTSCRGWTVD